MATLTEAQIQTLRRQVGSSPDDATLNSISDRVGTLTETAREILDIRLSDLRAAPAQFSIPDEYSQSTMENMKALRAQLEDLGDLDSDGAGLNAMQVHHAERIDTNRGYSTYPRRSGNYGWRVQPGGVVDGGSP